MSYFRWPCDNNIASANKRMTTMMAMIHLMSRFFFFKAIVEIYG